MILKNSNKVQKLVFISFLSITTLLFGCKAETDTPMSISVKDPIIIIQPSDVTAVIPATRTLTVGAYTTDNGVLTYQWYKILENETQGVLLQNENKPELKITATQLGKTGYYCAITNTIPDNGDDGKKTITINSDIAWFDAIYLKDIISAPVFTKQPPTLNIAPYNQHLELECIAQATEWTVSYRWYESMDGTTSTGKAISNATNSKFETPLYTEKGIYYYYCVATNEITSTEDDIKSASAISDIIQVAYTGLPTLYLNTGDTPSSSITKNEYVPAEFKLISSKETITKSLTKKGIKGRGNSSWGMPKKGYNINFDDKISLFGLPKSKKWCLIANYSDKTLIRNKYASILGTDDSFFNSTWNPSFNYVDLIMNGEYMGNYLIGEKIDIGKGRVEIQDISDFTEKKISKGDYTDQNLDGIIDMNDGGFIIEIESSDERAISNNYYFLSEKINKYYCLKEPDNVSEEIQNHIRNIIQTAENNLYSDLFSDINNGWRKYFDENSIIDWYLVNEFSRNRDAAFVSSVYMYYEPKQGKFFMGPNWDFDLGFGNDGEDGNLEILGSPEGWRIKTSDFISRLFEDENFKLAVKKRWNGKKYNILQTITQEGTIQLFATQLDISANFNFRKWKILGTYIWPNPSGFEQRNTYQSEVEYLNHWLLARYEWLDTAINEI